MVGTFPLNVQAGSLQYTLASDITPTSSTTTITVTIINADDVTPVSNAYYTIQNEDGSKWCTFYVESWTQEGGFVPADVPVTFTGTCTYSSSNTSDVFPEGSLCWCIWCKEYYDSLITQIGSGGAVIKSIEYDMATTTFTITDTNDQVTEINTSPSVAGIDRPSYNLSDLNNDYDGTPVLRLGYSTGSGATNVSDMVIVTPVISQTHEIYFDVSGTDLYVRRESPGGMYDLFSNYSPIDEGKGSVVVRWRMCDAIRFHIPEDNFGSNYSVNISCNPEVYGWQVMYIFTDTHASGEASMGGNGELPRFVLGSASNIVWIYTNSREHSQSELDSAYEIYEVTISISRRS